MEISGKKFLTFLCSNIIITMKNLELFPRNLREDFFLKIGIHNAKVYKNVPNIEVCDFCPAQNSVYQVSHCSALLIGWLDFCSRLYMAIMKNFYYKTFCVNWTSRSRLPVQLNPQDLNHDTIDYKNVNDKS